MPNSAETSVTLPRVSDQVSIRLTPNGKLADVPFVIRLFDPGATQDGKKIPAEKDSELDTEYDLETAAQDLVGYKVLCAGKVLFPQKDKVTLSCEFFVDGDKLKDSPDQTISGDAGADVPFTFRCKFV